MRRPSSLAYRVTLWCAGILLLVTLVAGVYGGASMALGVIGGGVVALGNFSLLSRAGRRTASLVAGETRGSLSWISLACRHLAVFLAVALLVSSKWADPIAVLVGISVLPPVLIATGLLTGRQAA